jgi:hypothetical protein
MRMIETNTRFIFQSRDENGQFELRIYKDGTQLQLETGIKMDGLLRVHDDEIYINTSTVELAAIRDMINRILEDFHLSTMITK